MRIDTLKLKRKRPKTKDRGRGGKKGTYSGRGNKGQKARSGAHIDPLFEGGRSTLIDHMKKKRGFNSGRIKNAIVKFSDLEKNFENGAKVTREELLKKNLIKKTDQKVKILGPQSGAKKFTFEEKILLTKKMQG